MNLYSKLIISLALVSGIAAGLLSHTYAVTSPVIESRSGEEREKALRHVFFRQMRTENGKETFSLRLEPLTKDEDVFALHDPERSGQPAYYAAIGSAFGYNSSEPVALLVGFTGPAGDAATLLKGYVDPGRLPAAGEKGVYIVGFSTVSSAETPGLGESIKNAKPPFTWAQLIAGDRPAPDPDKATPFQAQFRGRKAADLKLRKHGGDLDAITASTQTSNAVIDAIQDASEKLGKVLDEKW